MLLDGYSTFSKIINYLKEIDAAEFDEEKLKEAIKQTQFEELQKMEKNDGFSEKGRGELFFRKGKTGAWKEELSVDLIKKIETIFKDEMTELGYL